MSTEKATQLLARGDAVAGRAALDTWRELLAADPEALPTQTPEWVAAVCTGGRYVDASRSYRFADGHRMVLPLVRRRGAPGAAVASLHSMPVAWGFGGVLSDGQVTAEALGSVVDDLVASGVARIHVRPNPRHAVAWAAAMADRPRVTAVPATAHVLDLTGGFDVVWRERFRSDTRRQVRRARQLGVTVETDDTGRLADEFSALLDRSTDRWAQMQHEPVLLARARRTLRDPVTKLRAMAEGMGSGCRISIARVDGRPAAGIVVLQGHNAHYTRGAMDEALAGPSQANRLLHATAIEEACRAGCGAYHMGESGTSRGLAQFKTRFGAEPHEYAEYWIETFPFTRVERWIKESVKRTIGFRDA